MRVAVSLCSTGPCERTGVRAPRPSFRPRRHWKKASSPPNRRRRGRVASRSSGGRPPPLPAAVRPASVAPRSSSGSALTGRWRSRAWRGTAIETPGPVSFGAVARWAARSNRGRPDINWPKRGPPLSAFSEITINRSCTFTSRSESRTTRSGLPTAQKERKRTNRRAKQTVQHAQRNRKKDKRFFQRPINPAEKVRPRTQDPGPRCRNGEAVESLQGRCNDR